MIKVRTNTYRRKPGDRAHPDPVKQVILKAIILTFWSKVAVRNIFAAIYLNVFCLLY